MQSYYVDALRKRIDTLVLELWYVDKLQAF